MRSRLARVLVAGTFLGLVVGLVFVNHDTLKLSQAWPVILGFALWTWLGHKGTRGFVVGLGAVAGALLGWVAFAVPTNSMPVTDLSVGIVSGVLVAAMVTVGLVAKDRLPTAALLVGFAAFFGVFEPLWRESPANFRTHGLESLTVAWAGLLIGILAASIVRWLTDREPETTVSTTDAEAMSTVEGAPVATTASVAPAATGAALVAAVADSNGQAPATTVVERAEDHDGALLSIDGLTCAYGPVVALRDIVLHVKQGEVVCVLGVNGAGKTTLLSSIAGMVKPVRGTIILNGRNVAGRRPEVVVRLGGALVPEGRQVFPTMAVRDNLLLGAYGDRRKMQEAKETMDEVLALFPVLERAADRPAGSLSGGEQQMLAIGRALMSRPRLLMLDEPSLGLAPTVVERVMEVVGQLAHGDRGVLLIEQLARIALTVADRGYLLERGNVVLAGPSADLQADERVQEIYMGIKR
jgi:branched-chain amino acid transport system ATP-binding protein